MSSEKPVNDSELTTLTLEQRKELVGEARGCEVIVGDDASERQLWRSWAREMVEFCGGKVIGDVSDQQLRRGIRWHLERLKFKELL
jgi:hypothetical protein